MAEKSLSDTFRILTLEHSVCMEKPVVPVGNKLKRSFPLKFFLGENKSLLWYSSFSGFPGIIGISLYHLLHRTCSSMKLRGFLHPKRPFHFNFISHRNSPVFPYKSKALLYKGLSSQPSQLNSWLVISPLPGTNKQTNKQILVSFSVGLRLRFFHEFGLHSSSALGPETVNWSLWALE